MTIDDPIHGSFIRKVLDAPHDDLPRMVYSDFLEESAGEESCKRCDGIGQRPRGYCDAFMYSCGEHGDNDCEHKREFVTCRKCRGTGSTPDRFGRLFALIRVQLELDDLGHDWQKALMAGKIPNRDEPVAWFGAHRLDLRKREAELLDSVIESGWLVDICREIGSMAVAVERLDGSIAEALEQYGWFGAPQVQWKLERGFISTVRASLNTLLDTDCPHCNDGYSYQWPSISESHVCPSCKGTSEGRSLAARILSRCPVTRWVPFDKKPHTQVPSSSQSMTYVTGVDEVGKVGEWFYRNGLVRDWSGMAMHDLPPKVFHALPNAKKYSGADHLAFFPNEQDATDALSEAITSIAKNELLEAELVSPKLGEPA